MACLWCCLLPPPWKICIHNNGCSRQIYGKNYWRGEKTSLRAPPVRSHECYTHIYNQLYWCIHRWFYLPLLGHAVQYMADMAEYFTLHRIYFQYQRKEELPPTWSQLLEPEWKLDLFDLDRKRFVKSFLIWYYPEKVFYIVYTSFIILKVLLSWGEQNQDRIVHNFLEHVNNRNTFKLSIVSIYWHR